MFIYISAEVCYNPDAWSGVWVYLANVVDNYMKYGGKSAQVKDEKFSKEAF